MSLCAHCKASNWPRDKQDRSVKQIDISLSHEIHESLPDKIQAVLDMCIVYLIRKSKLRFSYDRFPQNRLNKII